MSRLAGKVALITGGNSGIGLATAQEFLAQGAKVAVTGRDHQALQTLKNQLGKNVLTLTVDVKNIDDMGRAIDTVHASFGNLDIVFLNAGIAKLGPIESVTEQVFDDVIDTNFKGVFFTIQKVLPILNSNSSIILNGSVNGHIGFSGASVYSASKAAVHSLAQTLAAELRDRKIRVNAITIGPIGTPLYANLGLSQQEIEGMTQALEGRILLRRFGKPEEIAKVALFLATEDASFITGTEIAADGGLMVNTL